MDERQPPFNISDVIEVIQDEMYAGTGVNNEDPDSRRPRPYVKIIEQPASKALRFRYECEGRSAGSIPGINSTPENKTYPGIQIVGHQGRAVVVVSCVTKDAPYRPHPHNLVGKEGCNRGVCTLKMNSDTITFSNLGIQCVKKKDIEDALKVREEIRVDPFRTGFSHKVQPSSIDLNSVRLCFQVFVEGRNKEEFSVPLRPVVSDPIYDKKAMSDLTICKLSDCSASVAGGKEIILLCEKVAKEDIQIRFYEERDGDLVWEGLGDFQPTQVHKQVAISFRTPKYKNIDVEKPVKVWVQLRRPSDGAVSESIPFQFIPLDSGRATFWSLRRALSKKGNYATFSKILNNDTTTYLSPEAQKRKLDSIAPMVTVTDPFGSEDIKKPHMALGDDFENRKDSLISGGSLITVPTRDGSHLPEKEHVVVDESVGSMDPSRLNMFAKGTEGGKSVDTDMETGHSVVSDYFVPTGTDRDKGKSERRPSENSQSFNDLISQVAELDEMYAETQERLILARTDLDPHADEVAMDCRETYQDNQTYSSLQLAMKNPVEPVESLAYEDVPMVRGPIIDVSRDRSPGGGSGVPGVVAVDADEKLPPLPPKRAKKTPPRRPDESPLTKDLPKTPDKTKPNLFQRLFSKGKARPTSPKMKTSQSAETLKFSGGKATGAPAAAAAVGDTNRKSDQEMEKSVTLMDNSLTGKPFQQSSSMGNLAGVEVPLSPNSFPTGTDDGVTGDIPVGDSHKESDGYLLTKDDFELGMDLTEAENYALYTSLAPHASMTELDEISFYYSPVEKGKILTEDDVRLKLRKMEMQNLAMPQNAT